uniref:68MP protein n=1 Tax=Athene cunicularia TaxID=194338 RepID=A0A663LZL3_ATHCN
MVQTMIPKSLRAMKFYFTTVYQEIWVGVAITAYVYYKISYGGKLHIIKFLKNPYVFEFLLKI